MTGRTYPPVRPHGRRGVILRSTAEDFRTLDEVSAAVRRTFGEMTDASIERIRTRKALKDLERARLVTRTPWGWRCTSAGQQHLDAT